MSICIKGNDLAPGDYVVRCWTYDGARLNVKGLVVSKVPHEDYERKWSTIHVICDNNTLVEFNIFWSDEFTVVRT